MKKLLLPLIAAMLVPSAGLAQAQRHYVWRIVYFNDAAHTTVIGKMTLFCGADEPAMMGDSSEFEEYRQGSC